MMRGESEDLFRGMDEMLLPNDVLLEEDIPGRMTDSFGSVMETENVSGGDVMRGADMGAELTERYAQWLDDEKLQNGYALSELKLNVPGDALSEGNTHETYGMENDEMLMMQMSADKAAEEAAVSARQRQVPAEDVETEGKGGAEMYPFSRNGDVSIPVNITVGEMTVREQADIDRIAEELVRRIKRAGEIMPNI